MPQRIAAELSDLPEDVSRVLATFLEAARQAFGDDLVSIVLYGSAVEGRLRPTSDVNLLIVLAAFDPIKANALRGPFSVAQAAIRLTAMLLLNSEVRPAVESFAQKFSDILRRRRVLYGPDPFAGVVIPRPAVIARLKQVLLNITLRLRAAYIERGSTPERLPLLIAEFAGPLRSCSATLLELEGQPLAPPREALQRVVGSFGEPGWDEVLAHISAARQREPLSAEVTGATLLRMIDLADRLRARVNALA
jgi:predicted nucleotidyltransferase